MNNNNNINNDNIIEHCCQCKSPSQLALPLAKFTCGHSACYNCIKNHLSIEQVLSFKSSPTISLECIYNNQTCSDNGYYVLSVGALVDYISTRAKSALNYNENENIYSSKLKNKNRDIEKTLTQIAKNYKEKINNDVQITCDKIDVLILYLNESKNEYRTKMENVYETFYSVLKVVKFLLNESEYYNDVNQDCIKLIKDKINFTVDIENEIKEQSDSIFNVLAKEIKNIKNTSTNETNALLLNGTNNNNNNGNTNSNNNNNTNNNGGANESLFSCDVEKVNSSNIEGVFYGHTNTIWSLLELNENTIASGSYDNSICIWNINNHEAIQTLTKHKSKVNVLININIETSSNEGSVFASGSADTTIVIWGRPLEVNSQYTALTTLYGHTSSINAMIQYNNDKLISGAHEIIIWDMNKNYNIISILSTYKYPVTSLCSFDLGSGFISGSFENIYLWSNKLKCVNLIKTNGHYVTCLYYVSDRQLVFSGAYDKSIRVWNVVENNKCLKILKEHTNTVWGLFAMNKVKLCSSSSNEIIIWDMNKFVSLVVIQEHNYALIKLKNGRFAYGCYDNKIKILNTDEYN